MAKVLVTSAPGRIGKELVALLARSGQFKVRAAVHSVEKGESLLALGADEVVRLDLTDAATYGEALDGVSAVYSASLDPLLEGHLSFSKAMGEAGHVEHVVRVSCMGADTNTAANDPAVHASRPGAPIPLMLQHYWWGEQALVEAGVPVTVLRCNFFSASSSSAAAAPLPAVILWLRVAG